MNITLSESLWINISASKIGTIVISLIFRQSSKISCSSSKMSVTLNVEFRNTS